MASPLRKLLIELGIGVKGKEELTGVSLQLSNLVKGAKAVGAAFAVLGGILTAGKIVSGFVAMVEEQIALADALKHNAERLGLTTDELQKYQYASQIMGVSVQETAVALRFFNRAVGEAALGTKSAVKTFAALGIHIKGADGQVRPTSELLFEFADRLKKIPSQAERTAFAMRTLGRNGSALLPMLQKGSKELQQLFKDVDDLGGGFNEKFVEEAHKTDVAMKRQKMAWRSIKTAIIIEVLPAFRAWLDRGLNTLKLIIDFAKHTYVFRTSLLALAIAVGTLAAAFIAFNPLLLVAVAAIGLLALPMLFIYGVFDDFYTLMIGGDSVLGRFIDKVSGKGASKKFVEDVKEAFKALLARVVPVIPKIIEFGKQVTLAIIDTTPYIIQWGGVFATYVVGMIDSAITGISMLGTVIVGVFKLISDLKSGNIGELIKDAKELGNTLGDKAGGLKLDLAALKKMREAFGGIGGPPTPAPRPPGGITPEGNVDLPPPPPPPTPPGGPKLSININNNITGVPGDPQRLAHAVSEGTKSGVKTAMAEHRDAFNAINMGMPLTPEYG